MGLSLCNFYYELCSLPDGTIDLDGSAGFQNSRLNGTHAASDASCVVNDATGQA